MIKIAVLDMSGNEVGEKELDENIFGIVPNMHVMHEAVVNYLANQRQGTQSALTRAEVSGGGKKPWRQKGTGHARQGSIRSPQWRHGGIVFAPKPRSYRYTINRKTKRLAIKSALSSKVHDNEVIVLNSIELENYSTKTMAAMIKALNIDKKALIVLPESDTKIINSTRNIPGISTIRADSINTYQILNSGKLVFLSESIDRIEEVYA